MAVAATGSHSRQASDAGAELPAREKAQASFATPAHASTPVATVDRPEVHRQITDPYTIDPPAVE
jgi:hypothetical protein